MSGGLSRARLSRMHEVMAGHVERGAVPGLVSLVSRHGEVEVDAIGAKAVGGDPIRRDTIFRIASMSKPITAVATLILVEECVLRLDEPVDRLLPELADRRVLKSLDGPVDDTVPATRPITVLDLLTFRMGMGMVMAMPGTYPIQAAIAEAGFAPGPPDPGADPDPDEWMRRLGRLPLLHQPGEEWRYHTGADVLGVLIARASGQPTETFYRERVFEPLGMVDTGFTVPPDKRDRLATGYYTDPETGALTAYDEPADTSWAATRFPSGGGGLVSTVDDYLAFGRMLLNKGRYGDERILSRSSVEAMMADQLTAEQKARSPFAGLFDDHGWGYGGAVVTRRSTPPMVPGRFGWDGGLGTSAWVDPAGGLTGILLTQAAFTSPQQPAYCQDFWTSVYAAVVD